MTAPEYAAGTPCWIELFTTEPDTAADFYRDLFGWDQVSGGEEFDGYRTFQVDDQMMAGCMANTTPDAVPNVWFVYLASTDAAATVEAARAVGMHVAVEAMPVGDLGVMAVVSDPGGAMVGIWQAREHLGMAAIGEPNSPGWFELHTRSYDESVGYYRDVFGWDAHTMADEPGFRYTTYGEGGEQRAGIMDASVFLPDDVPSHWTVYFTVADADASSARAVELGGAVVAPAEDTPYGRIATISDSTGAIFRLQQPPA
jgi:predicted enzyme related to lactoylglutathione lyase